MIHVPPRLGRTDHLFLINKQNITTDLKDWLAEQGWQLELIDPYGDVIAYAANPLYRLRLSGKQAMLFKLTWGGA